MDIINEEELKEDILDRIVPDDKIIIKEPGSLPSDCNVKNVMFMDAENRILIRNMEDLSPSTMTTVASLNGTIYDLWRIFYTLPCYVRKNGEKCQPGTITSVRYNGFVRGDPGGCFPHDILINIWIDSKDNYMSVKLSKSKITMVGCKTLDMGYETATYLIEAINNTIAELVNIRENELLYNESCTWLLANSIGDMCTIPIGDGNGVYQPVDGYYIRWPTTIPEKYITFVNFIINRLDEVNVIYHSQISPMMEYFGTTNPGGVSDYLGLIKVGRSMVNYSYFLGFQVDRVALCNMLNREGFIANFSNSTGSSVRVTLENPSSGDSDIVRRSTKRCNQSFYIYMSNGSITHISPGGEAMVKGYELLMTTIAKYINYIQMNVITIDEVIAINRMLHGNRGRGRKPKNPVVAPPPIIDYNLINDVMNKQYYYNNRHIGVC